MLLVSHCLCIFSLGGKSLQRLEVSGASALFRGALKGANYFKAQESPENTLPARVKVEARELWSMICCSCRPQWFLCQPASTYLLEETAQKNPSRCFMHCREQEKDYSPGRSHFSFTVKMCRKSFMPCLGFGKTNLKREQAVKRTRAGLLWGWNSPKAALQCHLVRATRTGSSLSIKSSPYIILDQIWPCFSFTAPAPVYAAVSILRVSFREFPSGGTVLGLNPQGDWMVAQLLANLCGAAKHRSYTCLCQVQL